MALSKQKKADVVAQVNELLDDSKLTVFAKYSGTSVKSLQDLRKQSSENGTKIRVIKNRLFKKALSGNDKFKQLKLEQIKGQLLYAFNREDDVAPAQSLAAFAKTEPQIEFVGGLMGDGKLLSADEVSTLSKLPGKNQLIAETVAMLLSPVNDITTGLSGDLHDLLDGLSNKAA
jgi:large subunit ribosomal protein L10